MPSSSRRRPSLAPSAPELDLASTIGNDRKLRDAVSSGKIDVAITLGVEHEMVEFLQDIRELLKIILEGWFVKTRKSAWNENLPGLDLVDHGPERVEAPLLRRLDQNRVAIERGKEFSVTIDFAGDARHEISADVETVNVNAIVTLNPPLGVDTRRNVNVVPRSRHPLSDLAHYFLYPTSVRPIAFTTEEQLHRFPFNV